MTAQEFHNEISNFVQSKQENSTPIVSTTITDSNTTSTITSPLPLVLLDVRNAYETEIGRFQIKDGDETLVPVYDPLTRNVRNNYYFNSFIIYSFIDFYNLLVSFLSLNVTLIIMLKNLKIKKY